MDDKDNSGRRKPSGLNSKNLTDQLKRKDNQGSFIQTSVFKESFQDNINEEIKERNEQINQSEQQIDQYNEDLESTKSFEIQRDDINEYFDYQSQKTTEIQRIRHEIQNLEKEKNLYLSQDKQQNQRHSFPLQAGSNRNPFKNISVVENNAIPMNIRNVSNLVASQNINNENIKQQYINNNNPLNNSNQANLQFNSKQNQNSGKDLPNNNKSGEQSSKNNVKYLDGLSMQRGDYSSRNEDDSPNNHQQQIQQSYQLQLMQQQPVKQQQNGIQQKLDENRASQEEKIRQLESMIQVQNQFMQGLQNQQENYYARLYGDIKKQYETFEEQATKDKKEMEDTIISLRKQLKASQEENQKKQKSLMKILNYYNTLKVDYEKLAIRQQQQSMQSNSSNIQNMQQLSSVLVNPYILCDLDPSEYGVAQQTLLNHNMNQSIASERAYLRQSKENNSLERQSYSNNINIVKEQINQNSLRNNANIAPSIPLELEDDIRKSIDSDGLSVIKGYRSNKSINSNPNSGKQRNPSNGSGNMINVQNSTVSQFRDDQNIRDSQQQKSSFIKNSVSAGNTTTSRSIKLQQIQQQYMQDQIQGREGEEFDEDINLFCDDDEMAIRQSLENNTKLFDNFFSPRGTTAAATATTTQTKYIVTGSTSTSSQDKMFRSDEKILEKQYWSSDLRENTETQPFSITKQPQHNHNGQNNFHKQKGNDQYSNNIKHKISLSNQQQYLQNQHYQEHNQSSSSSSQTSMIQPGYANEDRNSSISPNKIPSQHRVEQFENRNEENFQLNDASEENSLSFTKQQELKYQQSFQQSQLFKKALQNTNKHQNPLFLSHNDNIEFEIQNIQRSQRNNNHTHSIVGTSTEGLPINLSSNSQQIPSNISTNVKIQDSFNKLLSKSFSKIANPNGQITSSEVINTSNSNINQDNGQKVKQIVSGSSTSSSQVSGSASSQIIGSNNTQKQSKLLNQNLTISTVTTSTSFKNNNNKTQNNSNNKLTSNATQIEFQPSPKLTQKKKNFPSQINQYQSINNGSNQQANSNSAISTSAGGFFSNQNLYQGNDGQLNTYQKKEKMVTEPSESTDKSIMKQYTQRQNSQGFQHNQSITAYTNTSNDFSQNYNLSERNAQLKNSSASALNTYSQNIPNQNHANGYNNIHSYNSITKSNNQSQSTSQIKRPELLNNQTNNMSNTHSSSTKQLLHNSYQLAQAKHQSNSHLMSATSQYQIKTVYDNSYLSPTGVSSSKSKNLQTSSHQQLNSSSHLDMSGSNTNKSYNNLSQQQSQFNNLNKKLLSEKVNKLLQGKKQQSSNYNSTNSNVNNSENVNNINTSYTSTNNNVGMILSPTSKKQQSYQHNQYSQNNPNTSLYNASSFSKDVYSSKQRFHTLEN